MRKVLCVAASSVMTAPASGPSHGSGVAPALWYAKRHSPTPARLATAAALACSSSTYGSPAARMRSGRLCAVNSTCTVLGEGKRCSACLTRSATASRNLGWSPQLRTSASSSRPWAARAGAGAELGGPPQVPRGCRRARQAGAAALPLAEHRAGAVHRAQPPRAHSRRGGPVRRRAAGERRGRGQAGGGRRMALRVPERGRHSRAVARARGGRRHDRARRYAQDLPHRADRIRVRSCRGLVRHRRRVPRARGAAGCPARAHRLVERRSVARRCARGPGAPHRGGARLGMTCVVVGAGLTGLSAAWELIRAGTEVIVLESERRAGGVVVTERRDGFLVEGGPDGFLAGEGDIPALARELGLGDRLVDQLARGATLWTGHRLEPLAEGRAAELLGIQVPTDVGGFRSFAGGMAELTEALAARL